MKDISEVTALVCDYGKFTFLAECLSTKCKKVYYHTPMEREFQDLNDCAKGDGIEGIERVDDFLDILPEIDLAVFPDIGFNGTQKHLRSLGIPVWGHMGIGDLELYRTRFLKFLKEAGLEAPPTQVIRGLTALDAHLREVKDRWIKVNRYRAAIETYHHIDYNHTIRKLEEWSVRFGGLKDSVVFVVQDPINSDEENPVIEIGYDGWTVDGKYPESSFQGYELKNELYLGSKLDYVDLPDQVIEVNEAMSPVLKEYGTRNFLATEIRVKGEHFNFIDPTFRMAGLTEDQLPNTCSNLPEVIWNGANGELIKPEFVADFVAVATMHCTDHVRNQWFTLDIPEQAREWVKLYHFCKADGLYHFIPSVPFECDEAGVVIGIGDSIEEAIDHLKENFELLDGEPLKIDITGFAELLTQIHSAEEEGVEFTDQEVPPPEIVVDTPA